MDLYTGNRYVLLYFIYGLAFFTMGISALQQREKEKSSFGLLRANTYLGIFGVVHGIMEWMLMIMIARFIPHHDRNLLVLATILNAVSFVYLLMFGVSIIDYKKDYRAFVSSFPWFILGIWSIGFLVTYMNHGTIPYNWIVKQDILARYFIGLPACVITSIYLYNSGKTMFTYNVKGLGKKFKGLATIFVMYGILGGIIVSRSDFFPANIINREVFLQIFRLPVELLRATCAIIATLLYISIIDIYKWETNLKIAKLSEQQAISQERRNLAIEVHDVIIQNLFATGLQLEYLIDSNDNDNKRQLISIKDNLNNAIIEIREFMKKLSEKKINNNELKEKLSDLIIKFQLISSINISLDYSIPEVTLGSLSADMFTQIYYIIQEAVSNGIKHSNASHITISVQSNIKNIVISIADNGIGFDVDRLSKSAGYGLVLMKERAASVSGKFDIKTDKKGTCIIVIIPWEVV